MNDTKKAIRLKKLPSATVTLNHDKGSNNISEDNAAGASPAKDKVDYIISVGLGCYVDNLKHKAKVRVLHICLLLSVVEAGDLGGWYPRVSYLQ